MSDQRYAPWTFEEESAKKLLDVSTKLLEKWTAA
jgi:hypothetical protein